MKKVKLNKLIKVVFYTLIILFIIIAFVILSPFEMLARRAVFPFVAFSAIAYFLLGLVLVVSTLKSKLKGRQRKYLILTGASASGFFIGAILHNLLYALAELTSGVVILHWLFEFLHGFFFIAAVIFCPLGFVVGVIGYFTVLHKRIK